MGKIIGSHQRNKPVQEFIENNFALDRKIKQACEGLMPSTQWLLMELPRNEDKELIADFILHWSDHGNGVMMSPSTKQGYVTSLVYLSRHLDHKKSFKEMAWEDFFSKEIVDEKTGKKRGYLENIKRPFHEDPDQKWVNTHNKRAASILAFYKWWTQKALKPEERQTPPQLKGLKFAKREAKTSVKQEDLWTPEEHEVFLTRCEDLRLVAYHAIALETGGRPGELLELKIRDVTQIITAPKTGKRYCEFWIGRKGKTRKGRPASISDAIPYVNPWIHVHPMRDKPNEAFLFTSMENKAKYRNRPLKVDSLRLAYVRVIEEHFPKLLEEGRSDDVSLEEKAIIKNLIYNKPHYPYLRRHEFATEYAPKRSDLVFNQLMGHSTMSKMRQVYVKELGTEGHREHLIQKGILTRDEMISPAEVRMQPKPCPICHEPNKQDAKFCFKCNFIISQEGYLETKAEEEKAAREAEETKRRLAKVEAESEIIQANMRSLFMNMIGVEKR